MKDYYGITATDYLARARARLDDGNIESIFYAAFELRCGVEARMQEYLDVQMHISKRKKKGWQLANLGRNIEEAFRLGDKKAILTIKDKDSNATIGKYEYTPVKRALRNKVEKLGNILHSAKKYHDPTSDYWDKQRKDLEHIYRELQEACSGKLLGPVLLHPNKKNAEAKIQFDSQEEKERVVSAMQLDEHVILEVKYE